MADGKISVTLKEGTGFDSPWIVVSGDTVGEVRDQLNAVEASGIIVDVGRVASQFKGVAALGGTLGARPVAAPNAAPDGAQPGAQQPATATAQPTAQSNPGWGAQGQQQGTQQPTGGNVPQGGPRIVVDNFKNEWEYDVAGAPDTPRGPAIVKRGTGGKGPWRKWYDPCKGPEWFAQRQPRVDNAQVWQGEFIN